MTKLGFLRLSYEKQDTLLKLLILSMAAVLCKCVPSGVAPGAGKPRVARELCVFTLPLLSVFAAFSTRLFSVLRFESVIHEFDP